jgi:hypothetical protein
MEMCCVSRRSRVYLCEMPVPPARRRILERRIAAGAIGLAALFAMLALGFRFVFPDAWFSFQFPPAPGRGLEAFNLYLWLWLVLKGFVVATILGAIVRVLTRRRWATAWIGLALPVVICLGAAVLHAAFYGITTRRVDRLAGDVEEPSLVAQALAVSGAVTFVLAACFLCVTSLRRTPPGVRQAARTVAATLIGVVLILFWLQMILPMSNGWEPVRWDAPELLVPVRPCRGATLWQPSAKRLRFPYRFAVIDDVWLRFADPRANGASVWAVSASGEWEAAYYWLNRADVATLLVRSDDPAVVRCDSRVRVEPVAAAAWHRVGVE